MRPQIVTRSVLGILQKFPLRYVIDPYHFVDVDSTKGFYFSRHGYPRSIVDKRYNVHYTLSQNMAMTALIKKHNYIAVSTTINKTAFVTNRTSILVVDCDNTKGLKKAKEYIEDVYDSGTYVIESSPAHYWVVADIIDRTSTIMSILKDIPGVDPLYVKYSNEYRKDLLLRAVPKGKCIPKFPDGFGDITTPDIKRWINEFSNYFTSEHMENYYTAAIMDAIEEESMDNLEGLVLLGELKHGM